MEGEKRDGGVGGGIGGGVGGGVVGGVEVVAVLSIFYVLIHAIIW